MGKTPRRARFAETVGYHWRLAKQVPDLLWRSGERWVTIPLVVIGVVGLFSTAAGRWLNALWFGAPFWIGLGLLVVIFLYYLMKANYVAFKEIEGDRDVARSDRATAAQERDLERSEWERVEAENRTLKQPAGGTHVGTIHGPVGSVGQTGGQTTQVNLGRQNRSFVAKDLRQFEASLRPYTGTKVGVTCLMGDGEAHSFADQIKQVLEGVGWQVEGINQSVFSGPVRGIEIRIPGANADGHPWVGPLGTGLIQLGFPTIGVLNHPDPLPQIVVGAA